MPRDRYDPNLFAGRDTDLQHIDKWLRDPGDCRLRSVTGSPGGGKTWLLEQVRQRYNADPGYLVLWTDAPSLASSTSVSDAIAQLVREAAEGCGFNPSYLLDPSLAAEQRMRELGRRVCARCPSRIPLLIVDGIDELTWQNDRERVEDLLLAFLSDGSCARALIARRDEQALRLFGLQLIEVVHPLGGFNPQETRDQVEKRFIHRHGLTHPPDFMEFLQNQIPEYNGSHPSMNAFLTDWMARPSQTLSADVLEACLRDAVGGPLSDRALHLLRVLCCRDDWTPADLGDSGIPIGDPGMMELFHLGILVDAPRYRYRIAEGFRGMARAWRRLQSSPC
ncbi:AAA family ATPase [Thermoflexus hugenholtzii]